MTNIKRAAILKKLRQANKEMASVNKIISNAFAAHEYKNKKAA